MPDGLYEHDLLIWAEQQADLLRRLAAGERVNEVIDWPHLIEEVRDLGLSELRACESWIRQALIHLAKIKLNPGSPAVDGWTDEVEAFLSDLQSHFTPSMARRIDLDKLYAKALKRVDRSDRLPRACPVALDNLLAEDWRITDLLAKFDPPS